jgi:hypothetical protein
VTAVQAARIDGAQVRSELLEGLRVLIVGGIPVGVVVAGIGSRLAMLLLRITSPDSVRGAESDDGFIIGTFTLGGTYSLMLLGAIVGVIGAGVYLVIAPRLIGPLWFRRLTTGLGSAAVVGSMLIHADGIDFTLLEPTWLAIGLFVLLPGIFGVVIGPAVDSVGRDGSWTRNLQRPWVLPVILVVCFPMTIVIVLFAATILLIWIPMRSTQEVNNIVGSRYWGVAVQAAWLFVAVAGLMALLDDVGQLT